MFTHHSLVKLNNGRPKNGRALSLSFAIVVHSQHTWWNTPEIKDLHCSMLLGLSVWMLFDLSLTLALRSISIKNALTLRHKLSIQRVAEGLFSCPIANAAWIHFHRFLVPLFCPFTALRSTLIQFSLLYKTKMKLNIWLSQSNKNG